MNLSLNGISDHGVIASENDVFIVFATPAPGAGAMDDLPFYTAHTVQSVINTGQKGDRR
jgi:hypothetical protein